MRTPLIVALIATQVLAFAAAATAIPLRNVKVTQNSGSTVAARADVYLPPNSRYCYAFVRSYLVAAGPAQWQVIGSYGRFRVNFRPCANNQWDQEGVGVRFRDTGGGTRRICFEAWAPLQNGRQSRHYACTGAFTRR